MSFLEADEKLQLEHTPPKYDLIDLINDKRKAYRDYLSEFVCTFIIMVLGIGLGAQLMLYPGQDYYLAFWFNWAFAVALGFYIGGGISVCWVGWF